MIELAALVDETGGVVDRSVERVTMIAIAIHQLHELVETSTKIRDVTVETVSEG